MYFSYQKLSTPSLFLFGFSNIPIACIMQLKPFPYAIKLRAWMHPRILVPSAWSKRRHPALPKVTPAITHIVLYIIAYLIIYFAHRLTIGEGKTVPAYSLLDPQLLEHQMHTDRLQSVFVERRHEWIK